MLKAFGSELTGLRCCAGFPAFVGYQLILEGTNLLRLRSYFDQTNMMKFCLKLSVLNFDQHGRLYLVV